MDFPVCLAPKSVMQANSSFRCLSEGRFQLPVIIHGESSSCSMQLYYTMVIRQNQQCNVVFAELRYSKTGFFYCPDFCLRNSGCFLPICYSILKSRLHDFTLMVYIFLVSKSSQESFCRRSSPLYCFSNIQDLIQFVSGWAMGCKWEQ